MIIKLIKYLGNDDNMSMMEEQFDMTAPMGIEDARGSIQGNKIMNCHKTGLATLAQNRFQALTLHPWE